MSFRGKLTGIFVAMKSKNFGVTYLENNLPQELPPATIWGTRVTVENSSDHTWKQRDPEGKNVDLTVWIDGKLSGTHALPTAEVRPSDRVTFHFPVQFPKKPGFHEVVFDLIQQNVSRFIYQGIEPLRQCVFIKDVPPKKGALLQEKANRLCPWYHQPSMGIHQGSAGCLYPLFISKAKGYRFWDTEDQSYIDYVMGWGCALLGYAEPRVQDAMRAVLDMGAVLPLPHPMEIEVSEMLTEDIPSAERVVFGKNGSDVCTLAARVARTFTGRKKILFSGYHGWQDWWVEQFGFQNTGVPDRSESMIQRFAFNSVEDFQRTFTKHKQDLAAVIMEPAGAVEGLQGDTQDIDPAFLKFVAQAVHSTGALLVFDEILTGFRYPGGSAQKALEVIPDLTCLGKALGAGMPISALVGRASILERVMHCTHYGPTYRGEIYSLAAAKAAIQIYRSEPVAKHVWKHGERLKQGINLLCDQIGIAAECVGPPFRTNVVFREDYEERLRLKRTLYFQELLKWGVMTYNGFMLPCYSHDQKALRVLLETVGRALEKVVKAENSANIHQFIEIPLL